RPGRGDEALSGRAAEQRSPLHTSGLRAHRLRGVAPDALQARPSPLSSVRLDRGIDAPQLTNMRFTLVASCVALVTLVGAAVVQAKRLAPKTVAPPVVQGQTRYVVDYSGMTVPASNRGAYLRAVDVSSGSQLWRRMIYRVVYDEGLEADV